MTDITRGGKLTPVPEGTDTCGACGASATFPDGDRRESSALRSGSGSGSTPRTRMTGKKSPAGPLSPARSSTASERAPERAGETRQDRFVSRDTTPMPERKATCGDCGASMTFPAGGWEEVQRSAIDAWAKAHELAAHDGKSVSGWVLDPNPARDRD